MTKQTFPVMCNMQAREIAVGIVLAKFFTTSIQFFIEIMGSMLQSYPELLENFMIGVVITMFLGVIIFIFMAYHVFRS